MDCNIKGHIFNLTLYFYTSRFLSFFFFFFKCDSGADPESGSGLWHLTRGPGNSGRDKYRFQIKLVINLENSIEFITEPAVGAFKMIEGMNA